MYSYPHCLITYYLYAKISVMYNYNVIILKKRKTQLLLIKNSLKKKVGLGFLVSKRTNKTFNQYKLKKNLYKIFQTISHKIKFYILLKK